MKKYLYLIKNAKIPTYIKYWLMYSSKKVQATLQSLPLMLENTIKDTIIKITKIYGNTEQEVTENSPSPDYPSPVNNVTGDVEVKVQNKNLFDINNETFIKRINNSSISVSNNAVSITKVTTNLQERVTVYKQLKPYTTYTLSTGNTAGTDGYYGGYLAPVDSISATAYPNNSDGLSATATTNSSGVLAIIFYMNTVFSGTLTITDIQVEEGLSATTYIAHAEQNYPISLGDIELCKIGEYQDKIFKAINGNTVYDSLTSEQKAGLTYGGWYKYGIIKKIVIDGTEDTISYNTTNNVFYLNCSDKDKGDNSKVRVMSDYFQGRYTTYSASEWATYPNNSIGSRGGTASIGIKATQFADKSALTTWLSTHNTTVYYVLATPTNTQITDTTLINQLEAIQNIKAYEDITNISSDKEIKIDIDYIQRG